MEKELQLNANGLVKVRPTQESLKMMASGGSISGTIWRNHEIKAYSGLSLKRPVLDLGCGDGRFTKLLFAEPLDIGLDISAFSIKQAKNRNWHKKYIVAPADKTTLEDQSINSIFSNSVFEHITNLEEVIKEAGRVLKSGGDFVFTVHAPDSKSFFVSKLLRILCLEYLAKRYDTFFIKMLQLNTLWNRTKWKKILEDNGFRVLDIKGTTPIRSTIFYEALMPLTLLQNRITILKLLPITSFALKIIKLNLKSTGEKNYYIKAVKV